MNSTPADDAVIPHYRPLVDCGGEVVGLEALMRWHHQQRGEISPEALIPVFEECGLILPLSRWALKQACSEQFPDSRVGAHRGPSAPTSPSLASDYFVPRS